MELKKIRVLLVAPGNGNGGIRSWTQKYLKSFTREDVEIRFCPSYSYRSQEHYLSMPYRIKDGIIDIFCVGWRAFKQLRKRDISLIHSTSSGGIGIVRDYILSGLGHFFGAKYILHCRYGCIPEDYASKSFAGWMLRKTLKRVDNIWVLDRRTEHFLKEFALTRNKTFLTPNSIEVPEHIHIKAKDYKNICFIANIVPTKGIYELVKAVNMVGNGTKLTIVGPGEKSVLDEVKRLSGDKLNVDINILGGLPNNEAVKIMETMDIVALPTYYPSEAFPISILEAMSRGKLVISCNHAAIPDMLTGEKGERCGLLVEKQSPESIKDAIIWCQSYPKEADEICSNAYNKVLNYYDTKVVYNLYYKLYRQLVTN